MFKDACGKYLLYVPIKGRGNTVVVEVRRYAYTVVVKQSTDVKDAPHTNALQSKTTDTSIESTP